ncbi:hypothetical protein [Vibrio sp. 2-2(9)]|uniref:hypothetical protein n=2 Tax=Vibrionaceae TaxID=641 RepID=UPI0014836206|nr:hypothetical protein [Vibrio sp. 2-2(9)]
MMKFTPPPSAEQQLETQVNQLKQELKRRQFPKKNAPTLPLDLLVTISGCTFKLHSQTDGRLVLKADKAINFDKGINVLRSISYIAGARDSVSIAGWDWRPTHFKKDKLYLRPVAPTDL